jgi:hypothetical protein
MRRADFAIALVLAAAPAIAVADRGAITVELGPALTWWPSMGPAAGSGSGVNGSSGGGVLGIRYGLRQDIELTASGFYESPARFTNPGTTIDSGGAPATGTFTAKTSRWGVLLGARWMRGLRLRWFVGGEVGLSRQTFTGLDLINVSDPSNPHSFGLGLGDRSKSALLLSPLAGVEWQLADRWSVSFTPRVQVLVGGVGTVGVVLPVSVGYSWFGL